MLPSHRFNPVDYLRQFVTDLFGPPAGLPMSLTFVAIALLFGSILRVILLRKAGSEVRREKLGSLAVWWIGLLITGFIAYGGTLCGVILFGLISWIGLQEYFRLVDRLVQDVPGRFLAFTAIPLTYAAVWFEHELLFAASVSVVSFALFTACLVGTGKTTGYLAGAGSLIWGTLLIVFLVAHAAKILTLPAQTNPIAGAAGWFVYLIILTECDDIFQALWGRRFGKRKITPRISPNKSLEGLVGGVLSTLVIGVLLAPWLTPLADPCTIRWSEGEIQLPYLGAVCASLGISIAGFLGDLNMSALKRDAGVKDTGTLLPGQGGLLDRIDSLTFTAPAFYYFVRVLYG
jgi:phosphatidate cytidylyltransferase